MQEQDQWYVAVDGKTLEGTYSTEEVRQLLGEHRGKNVRVWRTGMADWADPSTLPEFHHATPAPPEAADTPAAHKAGFFRSLFDFRFEHMIALRVVPVLYGLIMVVITLIGLGYLAVGMFTAIVGITQGRESALGGMLIALVILIAVPIGWLIYAIFARLWCEILIVIFKIHENLNTIARKHGS